MATRKTRQDWQHLIKLHQDSNLTVKQFCLEHQIAQSNFYHWRKLLSQTSQTEGAIWQTIELPYSPETPTQAWDIELTFPNGLTLRMRQ